MNTSKSEIDFVIPAHNAERTIERTLVSLQEQSSPYWQAIVVDDGSNDTTGFIVEKMNDPRIHLIRQLNCGPSKARNHGFELGKSKLVCFLDADDTVYPNFVQQMTIAASTKPIGASCGYDYRTEQGRVLHQAGAMDDQRLARQGMLRLDPPAIMSMVYQRSALEEMMGSEPLFDESMRAYEDWDMLYRLLNRFNWNTHAIGRCDQILTSYWCMPDSLSSSLETVWDQGLALITSRCADKEKGEELIRAWELGVLGGCLINNDCTTSEHILRSIGILRQDDALTVAHAMRWHMMRQHGISMHSQGMLDAQTIKRCRKMLNCDSLVDTIIEYFACMKSGRVENLLAKANRLLSEKGRLVIYGLGRNGIEFISQAKKIGADIVLTDDQPNLMNTDPRRTTPCSIGCEDVVIVTPLDSMKIVRSLEKTNPKHVFIYQSVEASSLPSAG